jgi:hypothetical protein
MLFANHLRPWLEQTMRSFQVPGIVVACSDRHTAPTYLIVGSDTAGVPLRENTLFQSLRSPSLPSRLRCSVWQMRARYTGVIRWCTICPRQRQPNLV